MSLLGRATALVSVGLSCQGAHQLRRHAPALAPLVKENLEEVGMPWDWRIAGPADVAACIRENNPYPASAGEIELKNGRIYWPKRQTWFWHAKMQELAHFPAFSEKEAHLWANWGKVARVDRQIFIGSNTQNNLATKQAEAGGFERKVRLEDLFALAAALAGAFKRPELHWITRPDLVTDLDAFGFGKIVAREHLVNVKALAPIGVHLHLVEADRSEWQGNMPAWGKVLDRIVRRKEPRKVTTAK